MPNAILRVKENNRLFAIERTAQVSHENVIPAKSIFSFITDELKVEN
ncbi:MAG: hypothetical protein V5B38_19260 [Candidatus Accumulibacter propinquus]